MSIPFVFKTKFSVANIELHFQEIEKKDLPLFAKFIQNNTPSFLAPFPVTVAHLSTGKSSEKKWISEKIKGRKDNKNLIAIAKNVATNEIVCCVMAFNFDWRTPKCEMAWMVDQKQSGMGIASACTAEFIGFLFKSVQLAKVVARVDPLNTQSMKLATNLGFCIEGLHKCDFRTGHNQLIDVNYLALFNPQQP
ncbi:MAG: GNAT family N-acetyltransferase [Bacteroidia bacterium]|nr:GNAT family N-acetyltransferase [Bacteroidia bacterium]